MLAVGGFCRVIIIDARHRVGRVLSFFSGRPNWDSTAPLAPPPTLWSGGRGHTCLRERGWGSPNSDEGTYTVVLFIYKYFVMLGLRGGG